MPRASARQRGYNSRWDKARRTYLGKHPHCAMCAKLGQTVAATVVDHVIPHRGDQALFWNTANWQPLCKLHHDASKRSDEMRGFSTEVGRDGWPTDAAHPVNAPRR